MIEQEAQDQTTSPERLEELSRHPTWCPLIASNPAAPTSLLEALATDPEAQVRAAVASNPNTPWQTLEALAWEFPHAFLHNPVGPLQLLTHPEQISYDTAFWEAVLREAEIPSWWWHWLHPDQRMNKNLEWTKEFWQKADGKRLSQGTLSQCAGLGAHVRDWRQNMSRFQRIYQRDHTAERRQRKLSHLVMMYLLIAWSLMAHQAFRSVADRFLRA